MKFEWDENKNQANIKKHGINFSEAVYVFSDPFALNLPDVNILKKKNVGYSWARVCKQRFCLLFILIEKVIQLELFQLESQLKMNSEYMK